MKCTLLEDLNPREFSRCLKERYRFFRAYCGLRCIGSVKNIFGYYAYIEEIGEKRRIIGYAETSNNGAILYVEYKNS